MLANNIANASTTGYKGDREFYSLYQSELPVMERQWTDFSQGSLIETGDPLNLGLEGTGFFALNSPAGVVYTRSGDFHISASNQLVAANGYPVRNAADQGKPITADPKLPIQIDSTGVVRQQGREVGRIELAAIDTQSGPVRKMGSSYFAQMGGATPAVAHDTQVKQGTLEQSNVAVADSTVRLVSVMRQFEMLQRALSVGADMNKRSIEEVARVTS